MGIRIMKMSEVVLKLADIIRWWVARVHWAVLGQIVDRYAHARDLCIHSCWKGLPSNP